MRRRDTRRSRRGVDDDAEEEEEDDDEEREATGVDDGVGKLDAAGLLPFVGRTCMDLDVPVGEGGVAALRVQWRIVFDWTGEAKSEIGVLVGVPGKCESPCPAGLAWVLTVSFVADVPSRASTRREGAAGWSAEGV